MDYYTTQLGTAGELNNADIQILGIWLAQGTPTNNFKIKE